LTQFVAAIDGCVIKRYNSTRAAKEQVAVRYVFAPKLRVIYDVINRNQNLTLPVVTIDVTSIQRTPERVFNKHDSFYHNNTKLTTPGTVTRFRTPIPIRIGIDLSVLAGYQLDLDQIASNFMAYFNPYIVLTTKVPTDLGPEYDLEVRTKATWDDNFGISTPKETTFADKFRRVGDTSFTIDSWIYPEAADDENPIYYIDANFYAVSEKILNTSSYYTLSSETFTLSTYPESIQHKETISLSGIPTITNIFMLSSGTVIPVTDTLIFETYTVNTKPYTFLLYGKRFEDVDFVLLSSSRTNFNGSVSFGSLTTLPSTLPSINDRLTGFIANISSFKILNDNMLCITWDVQPGELAAYDFVFITYNQAGWSSTYNVGGFVFERTEGEEEEPEIPPK